MLIKNNTHNVTPYFQAGRKKKQLREEFLKALEEKRRHELKVKRDQEFHERAMAVYNKGKRQIEIKLNHQIRMEKEERIRRSEYLGYIFSQVSPKYIYKFTFLFR